MGVPCWLVLPGYNHGCNPQRCRTTTYAPGLAALRACLSRLCVAGVATTSPNYALALSPLASSSVRVVSARAGVETNSGVPAAQHFPVTKPQGGFAQGMARLGEGVYEVICCSEHEEPSLRVGFSHRLVNYGLIHCDPGRESILRGLLLVSKLLPFGF